jgi:hypothetical protein
MFNNKLREASQTMIAGGVDPKYVKRTVQELRDHFDDLKGNMIRNGYSEAEANLEAEEKIGNLHDIAVEATNKKELKSWVSLHPKTTFLLGPPLGFFLVIASLIAVIFVIVTISESTGQVFRYPYPLLFVAFMKTLVFFYMYVMHSLLALFFVYLSRDRAVPAKLVILSVCVTAFLCSMIGWRVGFPEGVDEMGYFVADLNILGFIPRISSDLRFYGFGFELNVLLQSLFRIALAAAAATMAWWRFKKDSWLEE